MYCLTLLVKAVRQVSKHRADMQSCRYAYPGQFLFSTSNSPP